MLQKHPRTVELGGLLLRRFDAWKITFLSGRSIFRGQASGISIPSYLAHTPSTSHTNFMLQNPQKARNGATTVKIWMIYSKVFWNKTTSAGWSPNLPEPCHKFWWELDIRPFKIVFLFRATSVPWSKQSHVEPRPKAIGGTESIFHDVSTWKGGGEHWEKIPIPSMRRTAYLPTWMAGSLW